MISSIVTTTTEINMNYSLHESHLHDSDYKDTMELLNTLIQVDKSVNAELNICLTLFLSICGIIFNILTFTICLLMLRSLFRSDDATTTNTTTTTTTAALAATTAANTAINSGLTPLRSNFLQPPTSPAPSRPIRTSSSTSKAFNKILLDVPTTKVRASLPSSHTYNVPSAMSPSISVTQINTSNANVIKKPNKLNRKRLGGKSRLMECYLLEIILFDFIMVAYLFADNFYLFYNRYQNSNDNNTGGNLNYHLHDSLEDISNFSCKTLIYVQKVSSLMSCWLIVCFSLNRLCLLISSRYNYLPFLLINQNDQNTGTNSNNANICNDEDETNATASMLTKTPKKFKTHFNSLLRPSTQTTSTLASSTSSFFSFNATTFGNFKLVINSKKSTIILFLLFALINIYFIEIAGLVEEKDTMFTHSPSTIQQTTTQAHLSYTTTASGNNTHEHNDVKIIQQHCGSPNLENKSVLILHITIHHIFGFIVPYIITVFSVYYLIKNLYKIKTKINVIISRKSQPLFIRSNELIFYRTSLTSIVLSIFYLITTLPYNLVSVLSILKLNHINIIALLNYVDYLKYLNHSIKFLLIYFSNTRFRRKANKLFSKLKIFCFLFQRIYFFLKFRIACCCNKHGKRGDGVFNDNDNRYHDDDENIHKNSYYNLASINNEDSILNCGIPSTSTVATRPTSPQEVVKNRKERPQHAQQQRHSYNYDNKSIESSTSNLYSSSKAAVHYNSKKLKRERHLTLTIVDSEALLTSIRRAHSHASNCPKSEQPATSTAEIAAAAVTTLENLNANNCLKIKNGKKTDSQQQLFPSLSSDKSQMSSCSSFNNNNSNSTNNVSNATLTNFNYRRKDSQKLKYKVMDFGDYYDDLCNFYQNYMNKQQKSNDVNVKNNNNGNSKNTKSMINVSNVNSEYNTKKSSMQASAIFYINSSAANSRKSSHNNRELDECKL